MRVGTVVKDAELHHAQALAELDAECFDEQDRYDEAEWRNYCQNAFFNKIIVAAGTNAPVLANLTATIGGEDIIYINSIAVSENYRKQGAATQLFGLLVDEINAHNNQFQKKTILQLQLSSVLLSCEGKMY